MTSFNRAMSGLQSRTRENTQFQIQDNTAAAEREGRAAIKRASDVAGKLSEFSGMLKDWKVQDIKKKQEEGLAEARRHQVEDSQKLAALAEELARTKKEDTRYQEIKAEMLEMGGTNAYPDADRIANLSPWARVGYAKEKLRAFNETYEDKLAHEMANSEKALTINGVTFTPKQLAENNVHGLAFKEAAVRSLGADIRKAANIDRFSPELLKLGGTTDSITKAEESLMSKYRNRYNIDSSFTTRQKAKMEWDSSLKTGEDLYRLQLITANTIDRNGQIIGNTVGWDQVFKTLEAEGIALGDASYADKMGAQELPEELRVKLGAKKGTTFAQQWPGRFASLKSSIKTGHTKAVKAELDYQKAEGDKLEAQFIAEARKGDLTTQQVNEWKRKFGKAGLPIPSGVTKYETATMRDEREDKQMIKALMASQNGYISNEQLDAFHPLAALEYREKATKMEEKALKQFGAEDHIKASLNTVFTDMGIKANEKSPTWVEALSNANIDYGRQFNDYIAMGYSAQDANYLALHARPGEAKTPEGEAIPGRVGVLHEIKQNGAGNKYTVIGQSVEESIGPGTIRVARVATGKREMLGDPSIIHKGTIGGDYGHRQLTSIKNNLEKYGDRGLRMDKGALQYYQGLARGRNPREGGWWGLVDAQLKATGHPGLNPATQPPSIAAMTGKGPDGKLLPDPLGLEILRRRISRAMQFPSRQNNQYVRNTAYDGFNNNGTSVYDRPENLAPHLR